jgi:hypothetical protein
MAIATQNGWKWNVEELQKAIDAVEAGDVTITADAESGLTAGGIQEVLVALATRVKDIDDIDALIDKNAGDIGDISQLLISDQNNLVDALNTTIMALEGSISSVTSIMAQIDDDAGLGTTMWTWSADKLSRELADIDAGNVTVTADAESGLTAGSVQDSLVALATRVKDLEVAG